jgi:hypothetical protein
METANEQTTASPAADARIVGLDRRAPRMRVDLTLNIPTLITLATLVVTISATGVGLYYNLDKRQMATDFAVSVLQQRIEKNEAAVAALRIDQATSNAALRSDVKSDIGEIKGMLNQMIFAPRPSPSQQRQLREWSKDQ